MLEKITIMTQKNTLERAKKIQYRDTVKILYDILLACNDKNTILSHLSRKAKLNDTTAKPLLNKLIKIGYVKNSDTGKSVRTGKIIVYSTTSKGLVFLEAISEWINIDS